MTFFVGLGDTFEGRAWWESIAR